MPQKFLCRRPILPPPVEMPDYEGLIYTWGTSASGLLANDGGGDHFTPGQAENLGKLWSTVHLGGSTGLGITVDGELYTWGLSGSYELGLGFVGSLPAVVDVPTKVGSSDKWRKAGRWGAAALQDDGSLWAWGPNTGGRNGNGLTTGYVLTPIKVGDGAFVDVFSAQSVILVRKADGTLWGVGTRNNFGLGSQAGNALELEQVGEATDWTSKVSIARNYGTPVMATIKADGTLWTGGGGRYCGRNLTATTLVSLAQVGSDTNWKEVSVSGSGVYTLAVKEDGTLWGWGYSGYSGLGLPVLGTNINNSAHYYLVPTQIGTDTDWETVSAGNEHTIAMKTDGTIWTAGSNLGYRTGLNTGAGATTEFTQIGTDDDWTFISASFVSGMALKAPPEE